MNPLDHLAVPRRHFCTTTGAGFGSLALLSLLERERHAAAAGTVSPLAPDRRTSSHGRRR